MARKTYDCFRPGKKWLDTNGKPIQAHGFSVFFKDGVYYWYGENKEFTKKGGKIWHYGVRCYTSKDLYNWEDKGLIIPPTPDDLTSPLHPTYCMDRPHIVYCEKTGKYVAWLKIMGSGNTQFMSVLQADDFLGPYSFVHKIYQPLQMDSGDFTLVADKKTGKGYIIFERPHFELVCATLSDDYTAVTGEYSEHFEGLLPPYTREAPTYFEYNGKHYLFTSGTTGYFANPSRVCEFTDFHGEYKDLGDPHIGDKSKTSFHSQITCVLKIEGTDKYIAMADRWYSGGFKYFLSSKMTGIFENLGKSERGKHLLVIDKSPRANATLSGEEVIHSENTCKATYVWLPIEFDSDNKPCIRWRSKWTI